MTATNDSQKEFMMENLLNVKTCPNCGANVQGSRCSYCGAVDSSFVPISPGEDILVTFEHDGAKYSMKVVVSSIDLRCDYHDETFLYADGRLYTQFRTMTDYGFVLQGRLVPFDASDNLTGVYFVKENE